MKFTWSEAKRKSNLKARGLDFADAPEVFAGPTFTFEDDRFLYNEPRFVTLGLFKGYSNFHRSYRESRSHSRHLFSQGD